MTIHSYKFDEGTLLLGTGPAFDVSAQMRAVTVKWSETVATIDAIAVLSGEEIPEEEEATYKATISGTFLQDLAVGGVIDWTWLHKGEQKIFRFVPDNPSLRGVEGTCTIVPLDVGGEISKPANRPTSDFEWRIIGDPIFGPADPVTHDVAEDV